MIVLDTTVLLYASGSEHPLRSPCRNLIAAITDGTVEATTTPEVIQELAHVRGRRLGRAEAVRTARDFSALLRPVIVVDEAALTLGLRLFEELPELGSFDAVLAAVAITSSADALVSADRGFGSVKGLVHLDPSTPSFLERVGASPGAPRDTKTGGARNAE